MDYNQIPNDDPMRIQFNQARQFAMTHDIGYPMVNKATGRTEYYLGIDLNTGQPITSPVKPTAAQSFALNPSASH